MQLVQLDMKQISSEAEIYDCLVGQMNFTNADEKPEWMNVIEMNERDPYEMDTAFCSSYYLCLCFFSISHTP